MGIGQLLTSEMRKRNWNQSALARHLGVKQQLVSRWMDEEAGSRHSMESCQVIAERLGYSLSDVQRLAGYPVAPSIEAGAVPDPHWEIVQRELHAIYQSWEESRWDDLLDAHRAVANLARPSPDHRDDDDPMVDIIHIGTNSMVVV